MCQNCLVQILLQASINHLLVNAAKKFIILIEFGHLATLFRTVLKPPVSYVSELSYDAS